MSVEAITWALRQNAPSSTSKFILVALANCARAEDGLAWPSIAYLCEATQQDRKTVIANLGRLEVALLVRKSGTAGRTKQVNVYELALTPFDQSQKRNGSEIGTVPKLPSNGTVSPSKESRFSVPPVPKTGHGTVRNHKGTVKEPKEPSALVDADGDDDQPGSIPVCPQLKLLELFAEKAPSLPRPMPELWDGTKAKNLRARWRWVLTAVRSSGKRQGERYANTEEEGIAFFARFFAYVEASNFLTGRDEANWMGCSIEWLAKQSNFSKVLQGNYENKAMTA